MDQEEGSDEEGSNYDQLAAAMAADAPPEGSSSEDEQFEGQLSDEQAESSEDASPRSDSEGM